MIGKTRRRRRRGITLVETALVLMPLMMLILGIMEYGRYLMTVQLFQHAAREGCRYAVTHLQPVYLSSTTYGNANTDVTNKINSVLAGQTLMSQNTQIYASDALGNSLGTWTNAQPGQSVCVKITGNYKVLVMTLIRLPSTLPISATAVMDVESF
jgi:Flp pilus assembly protein TadG